MVGDLLPLAPSLSHGAQAARFSACIIITASVPRAPLRGLPRFTGPPDSCRRPGCSCPSAIGKNAAVDTAHRLSWGQRPQFSWAHPTFLNSTAQWSGISGGHAHGGGLPESLGSQRRVPETRVRGGCPSEPHVRLGGTANTSLTKTPALWHQVTARRGQRPQRGHSIRQSLCPESTLHARHTSALF